MSFLTKLPRDLYASDGFAGFEGEGRFSLGDGRAMMWMSQLAYETDEPEKIQDILRMWGMAPGGKSVIAGEVKTLLPLAQTRAVMAAGRGAAIVAFAGGDPLVLANWITVLDVRTGGSQIAKGFDLATGCVWPQLHALLQEPQAQGARIFLTGHSLGGALAVLAADRILKGGGRVDAVYTFGMPRPGTKEFAAAYNERIGGRTYRLVYGCDLVPALPPPALGFRHVGRYLHCESGGTFKCEALEEGTDSDSPVFLPEIAGDLKEIARAPLSTAAEAARRLRSAVLLASGHGSEGARRDFKGVAMALLPPRLRDHIPACYIDGFARPPQEDE
ncbi:MAG TPA: lipase family protein [Methylocella sp.]|nr:lipase family protein [Methylocella sp.]